MQKRRHQANNQNTYQHYIFKTPKTKENQERNPYLKNLEGGEKRVKEFKFFSNFDFLVDKLTFEIFFSERVIVKCQDHRGRAAE